MLIDDLLQNHQCENVEAADWPKMQELLRRTNKFNIAQDFCISAESLVENYDLIADAIPYCRLPYAYTWIEVAQAHRLLYQAAGIHIPEIQKIPHRVGFLLRAANKEHSVFSAHQFWNIAGNIHASHISLTFDPSRGKNAREITDPDETKHEFFDIESSPAWNKATPKARGFLDAIIRPDITLYRTGLESLAGDPKYAEFGRMMLEIGAADWSGEAVFILAVLTLLNTTNAAEATPVEHGKLNSARLKQGKQPLVDYHILTISSKLKAKMGVTKVSGKHSLKELRMHLCRGHFKVRRTGVFWWRPHARGSKSKGYADKSYRLS